MCQMIWRIKLNPEKTKVMIFSRSQTAITAEPALSLYGDLLLYYPHIKFLGITFDYRMTFTKHHEEISECCNHKFHHLKILVKVRSKYHKHFTNLQTMCKTNIRIWDCFYHNCFGIRHQQNTRVQNSFIRLALRLPKYVSASLTHKVSGLPYVRERFVTVGQNHLARMHANPLDEHTITSSRINIA